MVSAAQGGREPGFEVHPLLLCTEWEGKSRGVSCQCTDAGKVFVVYDIAGCFFRCTFKMECNLESNLCLRKKLHCCPDWSGWFRFWSGCMPGLPTGQPFDVSLTH